MFWIPSQLEGAYIGQDATLECHSEAYPKSINYWVKKDGAMLISSGLPFPELSLSNSNYISLQTQNTRT